MRLYEIQKHLCPSPLLGSIALTGQDAQLIEVIDEVAAQFLHDRKALSNPSTWILPDITGMTSLWAEEVVEASPLSIPSTRHSVKPFLCHQRELCRRLQDVTSDDMSFHEVQDIMSLLTTPSNVVAPVEWQKRFMSDLISDISNMIGAVSRTKRDASLSAHQVLRVHLSGIELRCITNCTHFMVRDLLRMDDIQLSRSLVHFTTLFAVMRTNPTLRVTAITSALEALGRVKAKHSEARLYSLFVVGYLHRLASGQMPPATAPTSEFQWRGLLEVIEAVVGSEDRLVASFCDMDWSLERTPDEVGVAVGQRLSGVGYKHQGPASILMQHLKPLWDQLPAEFRCGELKRRLEISKLRRWWMNQVVSGLIVVLVGMLSIVPKARTNSAKLVVSSLELSEECSLHQIHALCVAIYIVRELVNDHLVPEPIRDLLDDLPYNGPVLTLNLSESVPIVDCLESFTGFLAGLESTHLREVFGLALMAVYQRAWRSDFHYSEVTSFLVKSPVPSKLPFDVSVIMAPLITQGVGGNISEAIRRDLQVFLETCKTVSFEDRWETFLTPNYVTILTSPFQNNMSALVIAARALNLLHNPDPLLVKCYDQIPQVFAAYKDVVLNKVASSSIRDTRAVLENMKNRDESFDNLRSSILRDYLRANVQTLTPFIQRYLDIRSRDGSFHLELPNKTKNAKNAKTKKRAHLGWSKSAKKTVNGAQGQTCMVNLESEVQDAYTPVLCGPSLRPCSVRLSRCTVEAKDVFYMGEISLDWVRYA
ncbi:MAG: hypothetical protein KVP17_002875 [Porospora cf. gigantea B]|uniref:uncharacterized protein n=1 Tax=Porospora cf. gigantea B TaxID=2853592 RepID=UPI003571CE64|nr:MAG: hypothetical protein KVP17_002875 [Porospora cf. gigantea B]